MRNEIKMVIRYMLGWYRIGLDENMKSGVDIKAEKLQVSDKAHNGHSFE